MADVARLRPAESSDIYDIKDMVGRTTTANLQAAVRTIQNETRGVPRGGTGLSSIELNQVVLGNGTSSVKTTKSSGVGALQRGSSVDAPVFDTLPVSMGGTGAIGAPEALENLGAVSKTLINQYAKNTLVSHVAHGLMASQDKVVFDRITTSEPTTVVLGNGTVQDIYEFFEQNVDILREVIGLATVDHRGLVPEIVED